MYRDLRVFFSGILLMEKIPTESVRVRSFFGSYSPAFGLNTEIVNLRIQSKSGKIRTRKTLNNAVTNRNIRQTYCKVMANLSQSRLFLFL